MIKMFDSTAKRVRKVGHANRQRSHRSMLYLQIKYFKPPGNNGGRHPVGGRGKSTLRGPPRGNKTGTSCGISRGKDFPRYVFGWPEYDDRWIPRRISRRLFSQAEALRRRCLKEISFGPPSGRRPDRGSRGTSRTLAAGAARIASSFLAAAFSSFLRAAL